MQCTLPANWPCSESSSFPLRHPSCFCVCTIVCYNSNTIFPSFDHMNLTCVDQMCLQSTNKVFRSSRSLLHLCQFNVKHYPLPTCGAENLVDVLGCVCVCVFTAQLREIKFFFSFFLAMVFIRPMVDDLWFDSRIDKVSTASDPINNVCMCVRMCLCVSSCSAHTRRDFYWSCFD